jgi:hypothetical protein
MSCFGNVPQSERSISVELSGPKLIDTLLSDLRPQLKPSVPGTTRQARAPVVHQPATKRRRCRCGICVRCTDNARWERIFAEKFADPTYYSPRNVRHESSLK